MILKTCNKCNESKLLSEFHNCTKNKDGKMYTCRICNNKKTTEWGKLNPNKRRVASAKYRKNNIEKCRTATKKYYHKNHELSKIKAIIRNYNITIEEYLNLYKKQNYLCKICEIPNKYTLHVDHCHKSNKIRGLLCGNCNRALGLLYDNIIFLEKAKKYLEEVK